MIPFNYHPTTHAIHHREGEDALGAHVAPIYQTSTFAVDTVDDFKAIAQGERPGYVYTRVGNPTVTVPEEKIAILEGHALMQRGQTVRAKVFGSGMGAISSAVLARVHAGGHVVVQDQLYGSAYAFIHDSLPEFGITVSVFDPHEPGALEAELRAHPNTGLVYIETPANPTLKIVDIAATAQTAHAYGAWLLVDNTFATPFCQRPLEHGADVVVHSVTKALSGHGVIICGAVVSTHETYMTHDLGKMMKNFGPAPSPFDTWLLNLGLKTFGVRMKQHLSNAQTVAEYLHQHPRVARVLYPGLPDHPYHTVARQQMPGGFGSMLSFELHGGEAAALAFMPKLRLTTFAVSLGNVDSLIQHPASMTHLFVPRETRLKLGITDGLMRFSVGIEDPTDLLDDLAQALG